MKRFLFFLFVFCLASGFHSSGAFYSSSLKETSLLAFDSFFQQADSIPPVQLDPAPFNSPAIDSLPPISPAVDSLPPGSSVIDSLHLDSLVTSADSLPKSKSDLDSIVFVTGADSLIFNMSTKTMAVYGSGDLRHKETQLTGGVIFVNFETRDIEAYSVKKDTTIEAYEQMPVLNDRGDQYSGRQLKYNFKTRQGYITFATTSEDEASYTGAKIKKVSDEVYFIEKGFYTTCDNTEHPHYGFLCLEMKVIPKEQVIGKWIWLTFSGVPFPLPLPFAVFPLQSGRRSGIITPTFGSDNRWGKYFRRFGYFWAIDDYMDLTTTGDFYTRTGYGIDSRFRYAKRYEFTGTLSGGYAFKEQGEKIDPDYNTTEEWRIAWQHSHTLSPTARFDANLQFQSSNFYKETSTDFNQLLKNNVVSNATYYKNFEDLGASLTIGYSRNQELESETVNEILPSISFNKTQFYPFRREKIIGDEMWYEKIGFNYSGQFQNRRNATKTTLDVRGGIQHNFSTSASPKFGYITISPSISYQERWYNKFISRDYVLSSSGSKDSLVTQDQTGISMVRTFDFSLRASSKLYGMYEVNSLGIAALRHIISPSISYTYTPDYSKAGWGYYGTYKDSTGREYYYNKYEREVYGGPSRGERQFLNFSLDHLFEIKTLADPRDTTAKVQKIQLLNLTSGIGYNFAADSLNFTDVNLGFRTSIGNYFNFSGSSRYSLYDYNSDGQDINRFLISEGKGFLRLKSFNFSFSTSLSSETFKSGKKEEQLPIDEEESDVVFRDERQVLSGLNYKRDPNFSIPWSMQLTYSYSESRTNPLSPFIASSMNGSFDFSVTPAWKVTASGSYDFRKGEFAAPRIMISRDLHCWVMNFTWTPTGQFSGYQFEIRVRAPQLQDLKIEKSGGIYSGR